MTLKSIGVQLTLDYGLDGDIYIHLPFIPEGGVAAIKRWLATQFKPDPENASAPWICAYADSASSTEADILKNLFTSIIFGRLVEMAAAVPSQSTLDAQAALRQAAERLEDAKKREVGLIPPD